MKNIIKSALFLIIICCSVTACGPATRESILTKEMPVNQSDKTMVIYKNLSNQFWVRLDNNYGTKNKLIYSFKGAMRTGVYNNYHIHMVEPGTYALEYLIACCGGGWY